MAMRQAVCLGAALGLALRAFGWGAGHDVVARAVAARLPAPWAARLTGAALARFCADNHYPDSRVDFKADARVTPDEVAYLAGKKMTNSGQFHTDEGRGEAFILLARALKENRPESALLWLAALSHSTADMVACNHDPIVHLATYGWNDPRWAFRLPNGKALAGLDLGWVETLPEAKAVWEASLAKIRAADSGKGAEDAVLEVMLAGLDGVGTCAPYGVPIVRDAAAWASEKNPASRDSLAASFSALGGWAVERLLRDFLAAERLARSGDVPDVTDAVMKRYAAAFAELSANRRFEDDSLTKGLVAPGRPDAPALGVVAEPTWRMNDGMFGFNDRVLAAQAVTALRKKGWNAALVDVRALMAGGVSAAKMPVLLVFAQKTGAYYTLKPQALTDSLVKYRRAGGKIVWTGGALPDRALCDFPQALACRADVGKGYTYSWTRLPVDTNAYATLALTIGGGAARKLQRDPSFSAGWHIPSNITFFEAGAAESLLPLATLLDGGRPMLVGAAWPKGAPEVAYLPVYAVFPYLWTRETPPLVPFELALDSAGLEALEAAFAALQAGPLLARLNEALDQLKAGKRSEK
jgi:hypothetical protein